MADRPLEFRICGGHPLAQGLVFAGFGRHAFSTHYHDSCADMDRPGNHGTLTGMTGADWIWSSIGRFCTSHDGAAKYITRTGAVVLAEPLTLLCWIYPTGLEAVEYVMSLGNDGANGMFGLRIAGTTAGDPITAYSANDFGISGIATGPGLTINTWQCVAATFASTTSRTAWRDGVAGTPNTTSVTSCTPDFTTIGALRRSSVANYFTGYIADAMIWNRVLSLSEISAMADPSNAMLSGLLLPPRRRLFAAVSAASGPLRFPWQQRRHRRMAGVS